jgi:hypothetical protein
MVFFSILVLCFLWEMLKVGPSFVVSDYTSVGVWGQMGEKAMLLDIPNIKANIPFSRICLKIESEPVAAVARSAFAASY